jgi:hypothetical protein
MKVIERVKKLYWRISLKKLPKRIKMGLKKEAQTWDSSTAKENPEEVSRLLDKAEFFVGHREAPPYQKPAQFFSVVDPLHSK